MTHWLIACAIRDGAYVGAHMHADEAIGLLLVGLIHVAWYGLLPLS